MIEAKRRIEYSHGVTHTRDFNPRNVLMKSPSLSYAYILLNGSRDPYMRLRIKTFEVGEGTDPDAIHKSAGLVPSGSVLIS